MRNEINSNITEELLAVVEKIKNKANTEEIIEEGTDKLSNCLEILDENLADLPQILLDNPEIRNLVEQVVVALQEESQAEEEASNAPVKHYRSRIKSHPLFDQTIKNVRNKDISVDKAANILGCSKDWIYKYLKQPSHSVEVKFFNRTNGQNSINPNKYNLNATLEGTFNDNNISITAHIDNITKEEDKNGPRDEKR